MKLVHNRAILLWVIVATMVVIACGGSVADNDTAPPDDKNEKPTICIDGTPVYKEEDVDEETVHLIESIAVMKADTEDDYYDILHRLSKLPKDKIVLEYKKIFKK